MRLVLTVALVILCALALCAQDTALRYKPELHGVVRGKYEYSTEMDASRFSLRNARVSLEGAMPWRTQYRVEMDVGDDGEVKLKNAWVRLEPWRHVRVSVGYQRPPFGLDVLRNPYTQLFINRSFAAKHVVNVRDVGVLGAYDFRDSHGATRLRLEAGVFNGSENSGGKSGWHNGMSYSARAQYHPAKCLTIAPAILHKSAADGSAGYTALDCGVSLASGIMHLEAEYLRKSFADGAYATCHAVNAMAAVTPHLHHTDGMLKGISCLARYDYMGDHADEAAARHRMTVGVTLRLCSKSNPVLLRINYEKYWFTGERTVKDNECDKLSTEIAIRI